MLKSNVAYARGATKTVAPNFVIRFSLIVAQLFASLGLAGLTLTPAAATANVVPFAPAQNALAGTVTGTVFNDANGNGARDVNETGVPNVLLTAFDGGAPINTSTDASGLYTFTLSGANARIELSLPASYQPSPNNSAGANSQTTVRFVVTPANAIDFGIFKPSQYCQNNPRTVSACFIFGNNLSGAGQNDKTVTSQPYDAQGIAPSLQITEAIAKQTGGTYGVAYQRSTKYIFVSAFMKRLVSFGPGNAGSDGTGTIYMMPQGAPADAVPFIDLDNLFGADTTGTNPARSFTPAGSNFDKDAFPLVGKMAYGDIEIGEDDATLWAVNLKDRALYKIPVGVNATLAPVAPTASAVTSATVPNPGCVNGEGRPFAVKPANGLIYVGGVCTAEATLGITTNLQAYVYAFNPTANTWSGPVLQFPLNYPRTCVDIYPSYPAFCKPGTKGSLAGWQPWRDVLDITFPSGFAEGFVAYPQPMLSDIEILANGDMVVAFRDRFADQIGFDDPGPDNNQPRGYLLNAIPAGDILRASPNVAGGWTIESNSQSNPAGRFGPTTGANTGEGPGNGEFYHGDNYGNVHDEIVVGGLAYADAFTRIVASAVDPVALLSAGLIQLDNTDGQQKRAYEIQLTPPNGVSTSMRKANGMGDVELMCDGAPIEIGNRIWLDSNNNGVQDPGELPIKDVVVRLTDEFGNSTTATTDGNGTYFFSSAAGSNTGNSIYNLSGAGLNLRPFGKYTLTVDVTQPALATYVLTVANNDATNNGDLRDSDAVLAGNLATIAVTNGGPGYNNHTYDVGFYVPAVQAPAIKLTKYTNGQDANTITGPYIATGGNVNWTYLITNTGNVTLTNLTLVDTPEGVITCPVSQLAPGASTTCSKTGVAAAGQYTNTATVTGTNQLNTTQTVTSTDPSHYFGASPAIVLKKYTNGEDADTVTGPQVLVGSTVTWTYIFTNTGNVPLIGVNVNDDKVGLICAEISLAVGQSGTCTKTGIATAGQYTNTGTVVGTNSFIPSQQVTSTDPSHYFGVALASLGNYVWVDSNYDGVQNEPIGNGVNGVTVTLYRASDNSVVGVLQTSNDPNGAPGYYTFTNLVPATYYVVFTLPSGGYIFTKPDQTGDTGDSDANEVTGRTGNYTLVAGEANPTVDAGLFLSGPGIVLKKYTNGFDADLPPGPQLTVGSVVTWTYVFTNTGNVTLTNVTVSDDKVGLICNGITLGIGQSNTCSKTGIATAGQYTNTGTVVGTNQLNPSQQVTSTDPSHYFGVALASLGNYVWVDDNYDGVQNEPASNGVNGVTVTLYNAADNSVAGVLLTSNDANGNPGYYTFSNLLPGNYYVVFTPPNGYVLTLPNADSNDALDSDANSAGRTGNYTLVAGEANPTVDAGLFAPRPAIALKKYTNGVDADTATGPLVNAGSVVNWLYVFTNTGNITLTNVTLTDDKIGLVCDGITLAPGASTTCSKNGLAQIGQYANLGTVVGTNQLNAQQTVTATDPSHYFGVTQSIVLKKYTNGFDADVPPGPALQVGSVVTWTFVMTNTSNVTLTNVTLTDNKLGAVVCPKTVLAAGESMTCTTTGVATAGQYANLGTVTGVNPLNDVQVSNTDPSHYIGTTQALASLGNFVWLDVNRDGQQTGESGVANVTVTLYNISGTAIATTTTDANGFYLFTNLLPNTYSVGFTLPNGYAFTTPGGNPSSDTDSNANTSTGRTAPVTLAAGETNLTIDAGLYVLNPRIVLRKYVNGMDADIAPGPDIAAGSVVTWTFVVTNTGDVTLTNVTLTDDKEGVVICPKTVLAPNETMTCRANGTAIVGPYVNTGVVTGTNQINPNQTVISIDLSHYFGTQPQIVVSKRVQPGNGTTVNAGQRLTYTLIVTNTGNAIATSVQITDIVPNDTTYVANSAQPVPASFSPFVWNVGDLAPGASTSVSFAVTINGLVSNTAIVNQGGVRGSNVPPIPSNVVVNPLTPTAVTLINFSVQPASQGLRVSWQTGAELGTFAFAVYRSTDVNKANWTLVTPQALFANGNNSRYSVDDANANTAQRYYYWLEELETNNNRMMYEPVVWAGAAVPVPAQNNELVVNVPTLNTVVVPQGEAANAGALLVGVNRQSVVDVLAEAVTVRTNESVGVAAVAAQPETMRAPLVAPAETGNVVVAAAQTNLPSQQTKTQNQTDPVLQTNAKPNVPAQTQAAVLVARQSQGLAQPKTAQPAASALPWHNLSIMLLGLALFGLMAVGLTMLMCFVVLRRKR